MNLRVFTAAQAGALASQWVQVVAYVSRGLSVHEWALTAQDQAALTSIVLIHILVFLTKDA